MDVPLESRTLEYIRRILRKHNKFKGRFLEIGSGDGYNLVQFAKWGLSGTGVEIADVAVKAAASRHLPGIQVIHGDFRSGDLPAADIVFLLNCLEHIEDDRSFLIKARETMKDDAILVLAVPANSRRYGFADIRAGHYRRYDKERLDQLLSESGLRTKEKLTVGFPICNFYTWAYNIVNSMILPKPKFDPASSSYSGLEKKYLHFPLVFKILAPVTFPVLKMLIRFDWFFSRTSLGNNFLLFLEKADEPLARQSDAS